MTSASARVANGPLTITAASTGFCSTMTNLFEWSRITQYSAANAAEQRANSTAHTNRIRLVVLIVIPLYSFFQMQRTPFGEPPV